MTVAILSPADMTAGSDKPRGVAMTTSLRGGQRVAAVSLYGTFGPGKEVDPGEVTKAISSLNVDVLEMYFNSMGGDPHAGFAIRNRMVKLQAEGGVKAIHTFGEGIVGSAATLPFIAGQKRVMLAGSRFFIHKGSSTLVISGTEETLDSDEQMLETYKSFKADLALTNREAADLYVATSHLTAEQIEQAMATTTSYGPAESVAAGFATHANTNYSVAACITQAQAMECHPDLPLDLLNSLPTTHDADARALALQHRSDALAEQLALMAG